MFEKLWKGFNSVSLNLKTEGRHWPMVQPWKMSWWLLQVWRTACRLPGIGAQDSSPFVSPSSECHIWMKVLPSPPNHRAMDAVVPTMSEWVLNSCPLLYKWKRWWWTWLRGQGCGSCYFLPSGLLVLPAYSEELLNKGASGKEMGGWKAIPLQNATLVLPCLHLQKVKIKKGLMLENSCVTKKLNLHFLVLSTKASLNSKVKVDPSAPLTKQVNWFCMHGYKLLATF